MNLFQTRDIPSWIVFQLLERCNLRCSICREWGDGGAYHAHETMAEPPPPLALRTAREYLPARPYFEFFGGEPLLYGGIWAHLRKTLFSICTACCRYYAATPSR